jgi:hypothetical protein
MPTDETIYRDNVRLCMQLNMFYLIEQKDLEAELVRLTEKLERYLQCMNEHTERVQARIDLIKTYL